jgi:hypothetical protein
MDRRIVTCRAAGGIGNPFTVGVIAVVPKSLVRVARLGRLYLLGGSLFMNRDERRGRIDPAPPIGTKNWPVAGPYLAV